MLERCLNDFLSLLLLLLIWGIVAGLLGSSLLPGPIEVLQFALKETIQGQLPFHLGITLLRLLTAFLLSMLIGSMIGLLMGAHTGIDRFFATWLTIALNIPALVTIILSYLWFGLTEEAAVLAVVLNKVPNVIVNLREGTRQLDRELLEMARIFRFGPYRTLRHVIVPQLIPYLMTAARTGLALIWKIVLVVELLGRSNGMGYQLHLYFQMFDVTGILAYSMAFIAVIQCFEWLVLTPLDQGALRWKR